jgi:hypothetical protein
MGLGSAQSSLIAADNLQVFTLPRRITLLHKTLPSRSTNNRSHLARRLLAHVTRQKQGVARTRLRSSAQLRSSGSNRSSVEKTKILNAYGGRKSVLYALMHSEDPRPSTGSPSQAHRQNRNERLKQLVAFAGNRSATAVLPRGLMLCQATCGWIAVSLAGCGITHGGWSTNNRPRRPN